MPISALEHTWRSRTAITAGLLTLALLIIGPLGSQWGLWPYTVGLLLVTIAMVGSLLPIVLLLGFVWHPGYRAERPGLIAGAAFAAVPFATALWTVTVASGAPVIHDVSTDTVNPPTFHTARKLRGPGSNPLDYTAKEAAAQRAAWPDLKPLHTSLAPDKALTHAVDVARKLGWEIIDRQSRPGYIEAVATTTWFGFKDDVVIRVQADDGGSAVDVRSVSRVGEGDLGTNARRIRAFLEAFRSST